MKKIFTIILCAIIALCNVAIVGCGQSNADIKVLLVSVDGLRPDAISQTKYGKQLMRKSSYSLAAQTIYPSVTLPCHMSMFYGIEAYAHGVLTNEYTPDLDFLGSGITETLEKSGKSSAMFFDWEPLSALTTTTSTTLHYVSGDDIKDGEESNQSSTVTLTNMCINHIKETPTDFTFLYYGMTDSMGHQYDWMSDKYFWAIEHIFSNLQRLLRILPNNYVVIITSDHGGGYTAKNHGSYGDLDMTIPFFMYGKGIKKRKELQDVSILDVAPTVISLLGVEPESNWVGKCLA